MIRSDVTDIITIAVMVPMPFVSIWVVFASHKLASKLEAVFERSPLVLENKKWMRRLGLAGDVIFCSSIFSLCINCRFCIWKGWVLEKEVLAVSNKLKMALYPPFIACWVWMLALIACKLLVWGPMETARQVGF